MSDKNFKVKNGLTIEGTVNTLIAPDNAGGISLTGTIAATSFTGSGAGLTGISSYSAPTIGSTSIASGATVTNLAGITINSTTIPTSKTLVATDSTVVDGTTSTAASGLGFIGLPQNSTTTGAYAVLAADAGKHIYSTATRTLTIPANSAVALPVGTTLTFISAAGATTTIAITTDTLLLAGAGTTGSRTLAAHGMATAVKLTSTSWIISGNGLS